MTATEPEKIGHEPTDIKGRRVLAIVCVILVAAVVVHLSIYGVFSHLLKTRPGGPPALSLQPAATPRDSLVARPRLPGTPGHQSFSPQDLRAQRAAEDQLLMSYGFLDRQAGLVHIPIGLAMELIVQRGLKAVHP